MTVRLVFVGNVHNLSDIHDVILLLMNTYFCFT